MKPDGGVVRLDIRRYTVVRNSQTIILLYVYRKNWSFQTTVTLKPYNGRREMNRTVYIIYFYICSYFNVDPS